MSHLLMDKYFFKKIINYNNFKDYYNLITLNKQWFDTIINTQEYNDYKEIYQNYGYEKINYRFLKACENGYLETAKKLYNRITNKEEYCYDKISMKVVCKNGHLKIVEWIINYVDKNKSLDYQRAFEDCCDSGQLEIAKYFYKLNINLKLCIAFKITCKRGFLNIAKWLYEISLKDNKILLEDDLYFKHACISGNKELINWLIISNVIDMNTLLEDTKDMTKVILKNYYSYSSNHQKIDTWLNSSNNNTLLPIE